MYDEAHAQLPTSLYKFAAPAGVRAILEAGTLKFSRPGLFNDEFDTRVNLGVELDAELVIQLTLDRLWESAYAPEAVVAENDLGRALRSMRAAAGQADRHKFDEYFRPTIAGTVEQAAASAERLSDKLALECSKFKVLCLSESGTAAQLWGNYAADLTGAALKFSTRSDPDSFFLQARPITYSKAAPVVHTTESFADLIAGRAVTDPDRVGELFLYTKSIDWAPEREWRVVAGCGWKPECEEEFIEFDPNALEAVVLGSRASPEFQEEIERLVRRKYPQARIQTIARPRAGTEYEIA